MLPTDVNKKISGFTLVEVMVIAPIVILAIGGFVSLIVLLTGDVLKTAATNKAAYEVQSALDTFEQDTKLAINFVNISYIPLAAQGANNITSGAATPTAFSGGTSLKIRSMTTTTNPLSTGQKLVYMKDAPHRCTSNNVTQNTPFTVDIIYYTTVTNTNPQKYSLWRRVVFPSTYSAANLCGVAWQQPTCAPVVYATGSYPTTCKGEDQEILKDVNIFSTSGYVNPGDTFASVITNASTVEMNLGVLRTVAGNDLSFSGKLRASATNSVAYKQSIMASNYPPPTLLTAFNGFGFALVWQTENATDEYQITVECPSMPPSVFLSSNPGATFLSRDPSVPNMTIYTGDANTLIPCWLDTAVTSIRQVREGGVLGLPLIVQPSDYSS